MASARMCSVMRPVVATGKAPWPVIDHSGSIPIRFNGGGWESSGTEPMDTVSIANIRAVRSGDGQTVPAEANLRGM